MILERFQLNGKNALVTGSARGLGAAIAVALAEAGANVAIHGRTGDPNGVCDRVLKLGRKSVFVAGDVSDAGACARMVEQTVEGLGTIDILVNNAGIIRRSPASEMAESEWNEVIAVNLTSVFRLCQLAGRHMLNQGAGKIVNI